MLSGCPIRGCHVPLQPPRNPRGKANLDSVWWSHLSVDLGVCFYVRDSIYNVNTMWIRADSLSFVSVPGSDVFLHSTVFTCTIRGYIWMTSVCMSVCPKTLGQPGDFKNGPIWLKFCTLLPWVNTWRCLFYFLKILIFKAWSQVVALTKNLK